MAIRDNTGMNGNNTNAAQDQGGNTQQAEQPKGSLFGRTGAYMSAGGNGALTSIAAYYRDLLGNDPNNPKLTIDVLNTNASNVTLHCGAILVSEERTTTKGERIAVVYTILVESTEQAPVATHDYQYNNKRYDVPLVLTDAFDAQYWEAARSKTAIRHGLTAAHSVISAGSGFIPREVYDRFTKGGDGNAEMMISTLATAAEAIGTVGDGVSGVVKRATRLLDEITKGNETRLQRFIGTHNIYSRNGLPVHADFRVVVDTVPTGQKRNLSVINHGGSQMVNVFGFLETIVNVTDGGSRTFGLTRRDRSNEPPCVPNLVITSIQKPEGIMDVQSIGEGLFAAMGLSINDSWTELCEPKYGAENRRDIGNLMIEVGHLVDDSKDCNVPINTQSPEFDERVKRDYISAMYRPEMTISIDFPESGDMSWVGDLMIEASASGKNHKRSMVCEALSQFTNGHFPANYSGPILIDTGRRILTGFDQDPSGAMFDPRIKNDYLYLLTALARTREVDIEMLRDWDVMSRPEHVSGAPEQVRLTVTQEIVNRITGKTARYVTAVRRYIVARQFLQEFGEACNAAGLSPRPTNTSTTSIGHVSRSTDIYNDQSIRGGTNFRQGGGGGFGGGFGRSMRGVTGGF